MTKVWFVVLAVTLVVLGGCASDGDSYPSRSDRSSSSHKH